MAEKNSKTKSTESTPKQTSAKTSTTKDAKSVKADSSAKSTTTAKSASSKSTTKGESTKATVSKPATTADKASSTKKATPDKVADSKKTTSKTQTTTKTTSDTATKATASTKATTATKSTATKAAATTAATKTTASKAEPKAEAKVETKATASKSANKAEPKAEAKVETKATASKSANKAEAKAESKATSKATTATTAKAKAEGTTSKVEKPATTASSKVTAPKTEKPATKAKAEASIIADTKAVEKPVAKAKESAKKDEIKKDEVKTETAKKSTKSSKNNADNDLVVASKVENVDNKDNIADKKADKSSKIDLAGMFAFGKKKNADQSPADNVAKQDKVESKATKSVGKKKNADQSPADNVAKQDKVESKATKSVGKKDKTADKEVENAPQDSNKISFKDKLVAMVSGNKADTKTKQVEKSAKSTDTNNGKTTFIGFFMENKVRLYAAIAVIVFILFTLILSISLGVVSANNDKLPSTSTSNIKNNSLATGSTYDYEYRTSASAGYSAEILGNVDRKFPSVTGKTEGYVKDSYYPGYGRTPAGITSDADARTKLIQEAAYLASSDTRHNSGTSTHPYNSMDANGFLYNRTLSGNTVNKTKVVDDNGQHRQLYKHKCAEGMYYGDVSDDEKAVVKRMTFQPRSFHSHEMYNVTGLYAPAGEVIKIQISEEDMNSTGGLRIHIGQALYNRKANNIWTAKGQMQRFPVVLNTMLINKATADYDEKTHTYTGYVGSFLGGPLYIYTSTKTFTATVSGGVPYSHFILGHTTPEEFEANKDSTAPYFDLEVWDNGVLHSGPKKHSTGFSFDDLYKVAVLWDKITSVTTYGSNQNIVFLYEPFVAAGAAVAFPSQFSVNCPDSWMRNSLNYETLTKSGAWGNLHEYHHNFQGFGVGNGGEVTNNALTLVSYALFSKISSSRRIGSYGEEGLGGWNSYTNAMFAVSQVNLIRDTLNASNGARGLSVYATLLHNFGAEAFMEVRKAGGGQSYQNYFKKWEQITHNNMSFYFSDMLRANDVQPGSITEQWLKDNSNPDYPMFIPIASAYQTGRSYTYDNEKKYFKTMQPYVISYGEKFNIDLSPYTYEDGRYKSGSIILPKGFTYKIKKITQPENGSISMIDNYHYQLNPNNELLTGEIYVTLEINKEPGYNYDFEVEDIDLILEFEQSHELKGRMLERTTYEFENGHEYDSITAFKSNYKGYTNKIEGDNKNSTQNSNTDIWLTADEYNSALQKNSIMEIKGKLYIDTTAAYRIAIRGRNDVAMFLSFDNGETYTVAKQYTQTGSATGFPTNNTDTFYDTPTLEAGTWVYFKEVLIIEKAGKANFIGLGVGRIPDPLPQTDSEGEPILGSDGNPLDDIPAGDPRNPIKVNYANAYRQSYQPPQNHLNPDYFYKKKYTWTYTSNEKISDARHNVVSSEYKPWDATDDMYKIENAVDGDENTFIHTNREKISEANPFKLKVKLDKNVSANRFTFFGSAASGNYASYLPRNFKIWLSTDGNNWEEVANVVNSKTSGLTVPVYFSETYTFSYYKVEITDTHANTKYLALTKIELSYVLSIPNGVYTPIGDKSIKLTGGWDIKKTVTKIGREYAGKKNSTISFEFTGNRLLLLSTMANENFEVYIDGKKVSSIEFDQITSTTKINYLSPELPNKLHNVVIKLTGEANFEAIVTYK